MTGSLIDALQPVSWPTLALVSARAAGLVLMAPLWSLAAIPPAIRGAMALLLAFVALPSVTPVSDGGLLFIGAAGELLLGVVIGLSGAVFAHGMAIAAEVVSLQMGLSLGAAISPGADLGTGGIGELKMLLTLVIYASVGGHLMLVQAFVQSFGHVAPGAAPDLVAGGRTAIALAGTAFDVGVRAAAPAMVALLAANLALALLSRAIPQLNTMMVAIPVTVCVGLLAIGAALPSLAEWITGWALSSGSRADQMVRAFVPALAR